VGAGVAAARMAAIAAWSATLSARSATRSSRRGAMAAATSRSVLRVDSASASRSSAMVAGGGGGVSATFPAGDRGFKRGRLVVHAVRLGSPPRVHPLDMLICYATFHLLM